MILERVFEVMEVNTLESDFWLVGGQAQRDIKVGDNLVLEIKTAIEESRYILQLTSISTYGHDIKELVPPLTGYLTLKGEKGDLLKTIKYLWLEVDK